jgi:O-succinylbenzoic acid--CoA ligase
MVPLQVENSLTGLKNIKIDCWWCQNENHWRIVFKRKTEVYETYGMTETVTHIAKSRGGRSILPNIKFHRMK